MSERQKKDWFGKLVDEARSEEKSRQAGKKNPPNSQSKDGQEMSLREKILQATQSAETTTVLRQTLDEAKECQASPEVIKRFADFVRQADELAVYKIGLSMPQWDAKRSWFESSWKEQEEMLQEWSLEDNMAQAVLNNLAVFNQNIPLRDFLRSIVERFERPLRRINTVAGLKRFLDKAAEEGLVHRISNPSYATERGVRITEHKTELLYLPKKEIQVTVGAWTFVKEAEDRAKANQEKLDSLREKATPGLTPAKISKGQEGILYLTLSGTQAVLLEAVSEGNWMTVRVKDSIGLKEDQLPTEPQLWDKELHKPAQGNSGKWALISRALEEWAQRQEKAVQSFRQERAKLLSPLLSLATFPAPFEHQGLTRLLKGEEGIVAMWNNKFKWGEKVGFFGMAIEGLANKTFILREVISDFPFPKELVGEKLPLVVDPEKPDVRLEILPRMEQEQFLGLKQVEIMLKLRLSAEARSVSGETAPEKENAKDSD